MRGDLLIIVALGALIVMGVGLLANEALKAWDEWKAGE